MIRLLLVRHGTTAWNRKGRYQGQSDVPLDETGMQQALALRSRLAREEIGAIYASDLQRAWQTASAIAAPHSLAVRPEPRLREIDFGIWDGLTYSEIERRYPEVLAAWEADPLNTAPHRGESLGQVSARVRVALDDIARVHEGRTVVLVAHGGSLQVVLCLALGLVPKARWQFRLSAASLSELQLYEGGAVLTRLSDCSHLVVPFPGHSDVAPC
ncbi:MAG: alpha-ribazole phosphatase [Anaerolineae bacterium]|nr:alpha-ribazole phosphatase [Anaerolineae bacterium]